MRNCILFLFIVILINISCDVFYSMDVYNKSDHNIHVYLGFGSMCDASYKIIYPDTILPCYNDIYEVGINERKGNNSLSSWKQVFHDLGTDTISVFILHSDTVKKYSWDIIRSEYKVLKRYDVSLRDLRDLNYTIYYPPTRAMRTIKMYPPYGVNEY